MSDFSESDESENELMALRNDRTFKERVNFTHLDDPVFKEKFRFDRRGVENLLNEIGGQLSRETQRNCAIAPLEQVLFSLRFLATNSFYHVVSDAHGPHKSTLCRVLENFVTAVNDVLFQRVVDWPATLEERQRLAQDFYNFNRRPYQMPCVAGCLDGTLISIKRPSDNEDQFVDRKGNHSLNCLMVCGPDRRFLYVSANLPGRVNDARVLRRSSLGERFEAGWLPFPGAILLGDSIYPTKPWLMTPIASDALTPAEEAFNRAHKKTSVLIECSLGLLKERFACLRKLRVKTPQYAGAIVKACCTLHNLLVRDNPPLIADELDFNDDVILNDMGLEDEQVEVLNAGLARRQQLLQSFV